jgi:hypothetical protein
VGHQYSRRVKKQVAQVVQTSKWLSSGLVSYSNKAGGLVKIGSDRHWLVPSDKFD